ncbi:uncharacterized protein LOC116159900 [Photinus pyralis]|nr:uncharacterized protein LOC116159900 [Photinus pyralis]
MVFPTNKSITAVYGQPLTLTIEFCANPAYNKVFWIARDKVVRPGNSEDGIIAYDITNSTTNCHQAVLFLTKVTNSDIGEYSFLVRSPNGISEGAFMVNMTYASGYIVQTASGCNSATLNVDVVHLLLLIFTCCY